MSLYHGYNVEFDLDRAYFMPFIQTFCFYCGWIPIVLALVLLYLLFNHSRMYSREFRNAITSYHFVQIFYDIHNSYLFTPYPLFPVPIFVCHGLLCRWRAPTRLLMLLTGAQSGVGSSILITVIFMRLRNMLPVESHYRLSNRQSFFFMGFTTAVFVTNAIGFGLFGGDDSRKEEILNRTEFAWVLEKPGALVWGEMFDTPELDKELYYLSATTVYAVTVWMGLLIYSTFALNRAKNKLLAITSRRKSGDQGNRMFQIQLWGVIVTFVIPMALLIISIKIGLPTSNASIHSVIRFIAIFLFVNNSMVGILLHLVMNRVYQRIVMLQIRKCLQKKRLSQTEDVFSRECEDSQLNYCFSNHIAVAMKTDFENEKYYCSRIYEHTFLNMSVFSTIISSFSNKTLVQQGKRDDSQNTLRNTKYKIKKKTF